MFSSPVEDVRAGTSGICDPAVNIIGPCGGYVLVGVEGHFDGAPSVGKEIIAGLAVADEVEIHRLRTGAGEAREEFLHVHDLEKQGASVRDLELGDGGRQEAAEAGQPRSLRRLERSADASQRVLP